ncbi:MAG: alkaline phosphatase D family protein, partial [Cyclobacteriaceae bacterium]|nr:alkaline phosphatase D family protein [Cyclobacteriaceae bacterium]
PESKVETNWIAVDQSKNFTKQWQLNDLKANTSYAVSIQARKDGNSDVSDTIEGVFKTAPSSTDVEPINFTVVTGHDYNRRDDPENGHKIYNSMMDEDLDFYVHTGDIEYYDKYNPWAMTEEMMRYKWDRLFALPFQRKFYANTTSYFIKDDHDVLSDDSHPGMTYGTVSFERGLEIFDQEQFPSADKTYKTVRWGKDLQVWIVEGRRYRSKNTDPDGPDKTIWGEEQKQWLYSTLKESDATYKIIISATPILGPDRSNKKDNHANVAFKQEGDEIREFINQFDNVFLAVGDRHWQYVSHLEGTNLWEFSCGPGSDEHAGGWDQGNLLPEHKFLRVKGGYLRVRVFREDEKSKIRFEHHDVDGNVVNEKVFGE